MKALPKGEAAATPATETLFCVKFFIDCCYKNLIT